MKNLAIMFVVVLTLTMIFGCSNETSADENLSQDEITAKEYIKSRGYDVISRYNEPSRYTLDREKLKSFPYVVQWSVQHESPEKYLGKEIVTASFIVKNHPLEQIYKGTTIVSVMLTDGKVIGGTSYPNDEISGGWAHTIDGKTLEDTTNMSYNEWTAHWVDQWGKWQ